MVFFLQHGIFSATLAWSCRKNTSLHERPRWDRSSPGLSPRGASPGINHPQGSCPPGIVPRGSSPLEVIFYSLLIKIQRHHIGNIESTLRLRRREAESSDRAPGAQKDKKTAKQAPPTKARFGGDGGRRKADRAPGAQKDKKTKKTQAPPKARFGGDGGRRKAPTGRPEPEKIRKQQKQAPPKARFGGGGERRQALTGRPEPKKQ